ncbi:DUF3365 domain-containing protein [Candidatus Neomarinimicrobiota bacterium]
MNKKKRFGIKPFIGLLLFVWLLCIAASLLWNLHNNDIQIRDLARTYARSSFEKDVLYRRWNSLNNGVYGVVGGQTVPNEYLDILERDISSPSGLLLTKINPAYMTRQVHELAKAQSGEQGHITSLFPIRPKNAPDDWERIALQTFEQGKVEYSSLETIDDILYMRLMKPLFVEVNCLQCHAKQGYQLGEIRGGISISVPMTPLLDISRVRERTLWIAHGLIGMLGLIGIVLGGQKLNETMAAVKILRGLIPICSSCKKIRDDKGYWSQLEEYIHEHTEADFTHGVCPDCAGELYPEVVYNHS